MELKKRAKYQNKRIKNCKCQNSKGLKCVARANHTISIFGNSFLLDFHAQPWGWPGTPWPHCNVIPVSYCVVSMACTVFVILRAKLNSMHRNFYPISEDHEIKRTYC